jgi:hypothetical protein
MRGPTILHLLGQRKAFLARKGFLAWLCLANVIMAGGYAEIYED